jgi:hypothetical protein
MNRFIIKLSVLVFAAVTASLVTADNFDNDPVPMVYLNVPLGGTSASQRESEYGAALSLSQRSQSDAEKGEPLNFMDTGRPRLLDLRLKKGGLDSLQMNGVSLVQKVVKLNADGSKSEETKWLDLTPAQWVLIGLGVGVGLCVTEVICDLPEHRDDGPDRRLRDDIQYDDI